MMCQCCPHWGRHAEIFWVGQIPPPLPFPLYLSFPSLSLEVGPLNAAKGSRGPLAEPQREVNLVHFSVKIRDLVAPVSLIFLSINEHTDQFLVGPNALWPTQLKFWVGRPTL